MPKGVYTRKVRPVFIPIGPSIAYVTLTQGKYALIDSCDAECAGNKNWYAHYNPSTRSFYATGHLEGVGRVWRKFPLHRLIAYREGFQTDHINSNTLDNRRCNLRVATRSENCMNKPRTRVNTSGYKGVSRIGSRWAAQIGRNRRNYVIGYFDTPEQAYDAYCIAAQSVHGRFARIK